MALLSRQLAETQLALRWPACLSIPAHCWRFRGSDAADFVTDAAVCTFGNCVGLLCWDLPLAGKACVQLQPSGVLERRFQPQAGDRGHGGAAGCRLTLQRRAQLL